MKNKALKRSLLIVPASVPLAGLVLTLSSTTSSTNVTSKTTSGTNWTFDKVNIDLQDNLWKNYNSLPTSNHNARYAPYRYINIFNSNGNQNFNDTNANWQYRAVGDSWFRLFDASNPGFPNNVNVSDWTGTNYATESGTLYSWQVDGFRDKSVDHGPWWNGNGYNASTDTKRFKIGYNLVNKPLHGSATQGAQSTFYTGAFYFSNDMKIASDIKIHLYIKVDDRNNSNVLQQKTYTIKLKEEKNANLSDYDISPWIGKVQKVNKDPLRASQSGDTLEAWLTNYAYLPYYKNIPTAYTNGLSADLLSQKRTWDNYRSSEKHNGMYDILVSTPTNMSDIRSRGFQLSNNSGSYVNFGLFQKNLINNDRPADIIYNNQGGLFVFNIEMDKKLDYLVAGAVAEVEFEPYNDVANASTTTFFGNTDSSTTNKSFFGSAEYRQKDDDDNQRIVSGFWKIADRSESQRKKFYTLELVDSELGSDLYDPKSDAFPETTLRITENGNSNINYEINKDGINRNKKTISTKSVYQDTKAVNSKNSLLLTSTINSRDAKKWKVKNGSSLTASPLPSSRFDSDGIEFNSITYTYTDLELAKKYVDNKQWLNKGQKDYLKMVLDNESGFEANKQYSDNKILTDWKTKIDTLDKQQEAIEKKYKEIRDFPLSNNVYDSEYNANITNKIIYALATKSSKDNLDSIINRNINKINFRSTEYNTESGAIDRTTSTEYSISTPSGASYNSLKSSMDSVYNALNNYLTSVINSGKTEIEKYFAKLAQYPITEQNSSTYSGNYNKAKNLIINTIKAQVKNLSLKSQLNPFVNLDATNEQIKAIIELISKVNKLNKDKNSVKSQIETYKQSQNDFNNLGSFEFASSTSQIDLEALDAFDKNLTNAPDKTIQNIFESTATLTKFYNDNNEIFTKQWIEKAKGLDGAINEFNTEIDKFNYLNKNQKTSAKNDLKSALSTFNIFSYNENTVKLILNNEFIKKINNQMASAFVTAKEEAKTQISALNKLTDDEKTQVKQEIDNATLYKDNYDENKPFIDKILIGSDKNIKAIVDKWTERARIKDYTATFDYPNKNIEPTTADKSLVSQLSISPDANGLETKVISISGNDDTGTLTVTYKIVKTSDKTNVYTQNKTYDITGFANEQNRVDKLNATPDYKDVSEKPNIQASAVVKRDNNTEDINWVLPTKTQIYSGSVRYLGYNDIDGKIKIAYKLQSTVNESAISSEKTAEITGFETEATRLNNLVKQDTDTNQNTILNITADPIKRASDSSLNTDYTIALADNYGTTNQVELTDLSSPTPNDTDGSVSYTYKLKTTRTIKDLVTIAEEAANNNNDIYSNVSASQTRTGFLTQAEYEQNQKDAAKKAIDNHQYLNDAQKTALKNKIDQANLDQLDKIAQNASDLNDAMKAYNDATNNIETIKKGTDYTQADADNKSALDNAVSQQKTDVDKTQGSDLSLEEVKKRNKAIQDAISNLNGDEKLQEAKDEAIRKINSDYSSLTDKQKEKAIALINEQTTIDGVTSQDATNSELNSSMKTLRDYIADQDTVTASNDYIYTTNDLRAAYDGNPAKNNNQKGGVIKEAEDLVATLNTGNNSDLMNKETIDALNKKIKGAIDALNGQERYDEELARLNGLSLALAKVKDAKQATDTASEIDTNEVEFISSTMPDNVTPVDLLISNPNELTGKLDLSYKYQSTKENLENVKSTKVYTLNNNNVLSTLTEQERVDAILADSNIPFTINENDTNAINRNQLPSEVAKEAIKAFNNPADLNVEGYLNSIELSPNNDNGTLDIKFKIASTKAILNSNNDPQNPVVVSTNTRTITLTGFKTTLQVEKEKVAQYINNNVPEEQKQALLDELANANTLDEVAKVQLKAEIEKAIADATNNYPYLNNNQLDAYKADLKSATSTEAIQARSTTANTLNAKMKELSDAVKAELTALTNKVVEDNQNNDAKTAIVYTLADADKKEAYDNALLAAQELLNKTNGANSELSAVETVLSNLQTAYGQLNGDQNQNALNERIDALNNLTDDQKAQLKQNIANADAQADAETIVEAAETLDAKIADTKEQLGELNNYKNNDVYKLDKENKDAYDTALENLQNALDELSNKDLTSVSVDDLNSEATTLDTEVSEANQAKDLLDGIRSDLKDKLNNFDNLTPANKQALINLINADDKELSTEKVTDYLNQALNLAKTNVNKEIDKLTHLTPAEKQAYKEAVNEAELNTTDGEKYDKNINDILIQAKADDEAKKALIKAINDKQYLNDAQKAALIDKVYKTPLAELNEFENDATSLDDAMKTYSEIASVDKDSIKYKEAFEDRQAEYNNQITNRDNALNKVDGANLSLDQVNKAIEKLNKAINDLNGEERLQRAKNEAIAKITGDNPTYTDLTDAQKAALIDKINAQTSIADVNAVDAKNKQINDLTKMLKDNINGESGIKESIHYTGSEHDVKGNYDEAIEAAKELLAKLNEPNSDTNNIVDLDRIKNQNQAVHDAIAALNGEQNIKKRREEALAKLEELEHINNLQKAGLTTQIDNATSPEEIDEIVANATNLNDQMGLLKEELANQAPVKDTPKYLNAAEDPRNKYDDLLNEATFLVDKENGGAQLSPEAVTNLINDIKVAEQALDGNEKFDEVKQQIIADIDALEHLNDAQKAALKESLNEKKLIADLKQVGEDAKLLDNAMAEIKAKAQEIANDLAQEGNYKYIAATEEPKINYDNVKAQVDALVDPSGNNLNLKEVQDLQKALIAAEKALDGETNYDYFRNKAIEKIQNNPNLTDEEKTALIDQLNNVQSPNNDERITKEEFLNNLDKIVDKAKLIETIKNDDNLTPEQKADLIDDIVNADSTQANYDDVLGKIKAKEDAYKTLNNDDSLTEDDKVKLSENIANIEPNSPKFNEELNNEKIKQDAIKEIRNDDNLPEITKNNLANEIAELENKQAKPALNYQIDKVKDKQELIDQIQASNLPNEQKEALIDEINSFKGNDDKALVILDKIRDQFNKLKEIQEDPNLSQEDKAQLVEDVLANDPKDEKYYEIAKNINKKQEAIDQVRQNPNLTQEQKDSISQNIRELDETSEEFTNKLDNEKARLDLIDQLHQEAKDNKISDETRDKLISETLNLVNDSSFVNNLNNIKAEDELIQQVKASDVLNDTTKATLINNILDNNATSTEFDNKHNQITQLYVDAEELAKAKNDLVDLTKSKKFEKLSKDKQDAINKAIADSDEILNNLNSYNNEDVVKQTIIDKKLKQASPILIWPYFVAASFVSWLIGMLIFVFGRKKK
ncbi:lipoprotein 17-related variable surface protein [Mycoplasma sp. 2045]|uniref:lipoprotein 17-related variable surface protein n=1 Tax=Mycoplasma sp. 2045 TaxID=2967301 RepID=UPI00211C295C|nr:lipoprotein 17-related variable surface protein [Mycoplasma sp. 2045]UUM20188.1 lipoprotein 17-related variable surface protein [Mycoplasma sp. 2045]